MAGFNINAFQSNISKYGVLQTNKFMVAFASPNVMQGTEIDGLTAAETEELIQVRAESVKVPGIALAMTDVNRYGVGPMQKMPFSARFTENSITFISDRNAQIYKYFYKWMNKIFDFSGESNDSSNFSFNINASYTTQYKDDYVTDLHIYVFDNSGNLVKDIVMYKAFPEAINDVNLGWNDNNNLLKVTVTFSYRDWAMVGVNTVTNGTGRSSINSVVSTPRSTTGTTLNP